MFSWTRLMTPSPGLSVAPAPMVAESIATPVVRILVHVTPTTQAGIETAWGENVLRVLGGAGATCDKSD